MRDRNISATRTAHPAERHRGSAYSVSNLEIWCECFGKRKEDIKPSDSYAIAAIMLRIEGWQRSDKREILPIYGRQRLYKRE
jgi:putative DNA primase/helicase